MKLRRQKRKQDQALDAVASVTKLWSEWQLAKRAGKGVAKAKAIKPPSRLKRLLGSKKVKFAGAAAVAGGAGTIVARKLKGDDPATSYTGPAPSDAVEAAAKAPDAPPPPVVPVPDPDPTPAIGSSALRDNRAEPAAGASALRGVDDDAAQPASATASGAAEDDAVAEGAGTMPHASTETGDDEPAADTTALSDDDPSAGSDAKPVDSES